MLENGLTRFAIQPGDQRLARVTEEARRRAPAPLLTLPAEQAALAYVEAALWSEGVPAFSIREPGSFEFRLIDVETWPGTGLETVKFRQGYRGHPVYATLIVVQMDDANELLGMTGEFAEPPDIPAHPSVSEAAARRAALAAAGFRSPKPRPDVSLMYYFDGYQWFLAYFFEDVLRSRRLRDPEVPEVADYVVDAHTGRIEDVLPRVKSIGPAPAPEDVTETALDGLGRTRTFSAVREPAGTLLLEDRTLKIRTCDFAFRDLRTQSHRLPGALFVKNTGWDEQAVSAHANLSKVAAFLCQTLGRRSWDNRESYLVASLHCTLSGQTQGRSWRQALWNPKFNQLLVGQRESDGVLRTYAVAADIVAHEVFHGVIDATARLEYLAVPGALNESYCDIFGVIVNNSAIADPAHWNWEIAEELGDAGTPLRDLSDPARTGHPAHFRDFQDLPLNVNLGGIHSNSCIHSHGFYLIATAPDPDGQPLFDAATLGTLFYQAMAAHLTRTSTFDDSRNAVLLVAGLLFRHDPRKTEKLAAIRLGFDRVGITEAGVLTAGMPANPR